MSKENRARIREIGKRIDWYKTHPLARRMKLLETYQVDFLLDVGANVGQYARQMRRLGYGGPIISFEPLASAFAQLKKAARHDAKWQVKNVALGDTNGQTELHVSGDSRASSLLDMLPISQQLGDYIPFVGSEAVRINRLETIWNEIVPSGCRPFLKVDVQGYEMNVLDGTAHYLDHIVGIQIEMSLVPIYKNEARMTNMITRLQQHGFTLMSLEYGFCDPQTGQLLQADGIFFRQ